MDKKVLNVVLIDFRCQAYIIYNIRLRALFILYIENYIISVQYELIV